MRQYPTNVASTSPEMVSNPLWPLPPTTNTRPSSDMPTEVPSVSPPASPYTSCPKSSQSPELPMKYTATFPALFEALGEPTAMVEPVPPRDTEYPVASPVPSTMAVPYGSQDEPLYMKVRTDPPPWLPPLGDPIATTFPSDEMSTAHPARSRSVSPSITPPSSAIDTHSSTRHSYILAAPRWLSSPLDPTTSLLPSADRAMALPNSSLGEAPYIVCSNVIALPSTTSPSSSSLYM
mmetsp:Transcript_9147/g.22328  ORF Transcript_9147/g.22328 Transcript_9147/m.22328 type:complete len:235 (+) Transcript_9147:707-1411(+)